MGPAIAFLGVLFATACTSGESVVDLDEACGVVCETWPELRTPRCDHNIVQLGFSRVLVVGGASGVSLDSAPLATCELIDLPTRRVLPFAPLHTARRAAIAAWVQGGRVVVAGGLAKDPADHALATAEEWDPTAAVWRRLPPMREARAFASACTLSDGRVLVVGGVSGSGRLDRDGRVLRTAEIYDPHTQQWHVAGTLQERRALAAVVKLDDGNVLALGGVQGLAADQPQEHRLASVEHFDVARTLWSPRRPMPSAHGQGCAASVLERGWVLVEAAPSLALPAGENAFEVYELMADAWSVVTPVVASGGLPWPGAAGRTAKLVSAAGQVLVRDPHRPLLEGLWRWGGGSSAAGAGTGVASARSVALDARRLLCAGGVESGAVVGRVFVLRVKVLP